MASAMLLSSCSSIIDSGYIGYKKNEIKYGKGVTKQFQQAVNNSNIEWLEEIITNYPDFNVNYYSNEESKYRGYNYETLKVICSTYSDSIYQSEMLKLLIKNGLDPNLKFSNGYYGLDLLCSEYTSNPYLVKTMLENGADPNNGNTAGFYNVDLGESNKEKLLLPIYWGIYKPTHTNAEDMLNYGAEVSFKILDEVHNDDIEGSAKSYQLAFKSYMERTGESPFTKAEEYAILGESDKLIEELKNGAELDEKAAVNVKHFICRFCNAEAIRIWDEIYSGQISIYEYNKLKPWRMLNAAAYEGNYEIVKYLFDEQLIDFSINTALKCAAKAGSYDICKYILENGNLGEQISCADFLIAAFQGKNIDVFRLLAVFFKDNGQLNELDVCNIFDRLVIEWNQFTKDVIDCLMDDCNLNMQVFVNDHVDYQTLKYMFDKGKNLSVFDLRNAIRSKNAETVKLVLDMGADPNQTSFDFSTDIEDNMIYLLPYDECIAVATPKFPNCRNAAIMYGTPEIVQLLIDYGAELDPELLYTAITESSKATFDVLFNAGASLDYKNDEDKETLIDAAKSMGRDDIVKILKKAGVKAY